MSSLPRLLSIATAVPPFVLTQAEVVARATTLFRDCPGEIERLLPAYDNAGIARRHSCVPIEWFLEPHGWVERNRLYLDNAVPLLERAARDCLARAGRAAEAVDAIVTVSTTGIATPSLDALLMERLPFKRDVTRLPIFGLGCAGGVLGLSRAATLARADPGATVLFLVVELCSLTFRKDDISKSNIIAAALFGDGAAAALIGTGRGPALTAAGEYTWPDSLDVMGWSVEEDGLGVLFSRDIPTLVRTRFRAALDSFLGRNGMTIADIDHFICHPGGAKVIAALEDAFGVDAGSLRAARDILRDYGNMSAATVLFVLERLWNGGMRRGLISALGPGFTVAFQLIDAGPAATP